MKNTTILILLIMITLFWAGMIAGISFLEAPVKFTAPSLTLPIGLDVGRHVFSAFNKVEIVFATIIMIIILTGKFPFNIQTACYAVALLLTLECFWLLPVLDERALAIIAGKTPIGSSPHGWYVFFEMIKLGCLLSAGYFTIKIVLSKAAVSPG